ncbi:amidohydrolase [Thalassoglobus sp.]|uniref:amidohydrolase n=1 Tax=Thalassoglobus sp. TaxID=2795869 RepID=UPI003AA8CF54
MISLRYAAILMFFSLLAQPVLAQNKKDVLSSVEALEPTAWENAQQIWEWAEPGYKEEKSSKLLADWLEAEGFTIQHGVGEIPTAFTATIGEGKPVIAILGEYDALPGLAQNAVPYQDQPNEKYYGHGCGHHLFGVASASAAISLAKQIQAGHIKGTLRYYGCPAEEGGSAKVFLVRAGLFDDVDLALHWHPSSRNAAGDRSSLARIAVKFRFHGTSSHAAAAPDQGRSALDAVELTNFGTQLLREHVPDGTRIHYVITSGGDAPNIVPNFAEVYYYVRHPSSDVVRDIYERVVKCAEAGALATETRLEIRNEGGIVEIMPNNALSEVTRRNLKELNNLKYTDEDIKFAIKLQETMSAPRSLDSIQIVVNTRGETGQGSTDVGDVSWVVPTTGFNAACWVPGTPGHSWQAVACGNTPIAKYGMTLAARTLAATAYDLFHSPEIVQQANEELQRRLGERKYKPLVAPDQLPPLNYRDRTSSPK